jgi:hypothetical protein
MSPPVDWESLFRRARVMADVLADVEIDFEREQGNENHSMVYGRVNTLQCARRILGDVEEAYVRWGRSRNDFGLSKIVPQGFGSTNAYEAARENLSSAHEMVMLLLAMQQR